MRHTMSGETTLDTTKVNSHDAVSIDEVVWEHITRVLADHNGNISAAARALGMHRRTLQRKLQRHSRARNLRASELA
jgi:two-component system response regulator RegA